MIRLQDEQQHALQLEMGQLRDALTSAQGEVTQLEPLRSQLNELRAALAKREQEAAAARERELELERARWEAADEKGEIEALAASYRQLEVAMGEKDREMATLRARLAAARDPAGDEGGVAESAKESSSDATAADPAGTAAEVQALSGKLALLQAHSEGLSRDNRQLAEAVEELRGQLAEAEEARARFATEAATSAEAADGASPRLVRSAIGSAVAIGGATRVRALCAPSPSPTTLPD